jgi:hypothetical protein
MDKGKDTYSLALTVQVQPKKEAEVTLLAKAEMEVPLKPEKVMLTNVTFVTGRVDTVDSAMRTCCVPPAIIQVFAIPPAPQRNRV